MFFSFASPTPKILIIDDDKTLQCLIKFRLEHHEKTEVTQATDGEKGLARVAKSTPDLIILDWMLPGIQGLEVLKQLKNKKDTNRIPVLMLTGRNKIGEIEDAFNLGADGYLTKPFSLQKLGEKVTGLLESR